jgi:hypothetical protein
MRRDKRVFVLGENVQGGTFLATNPGGGTFQGTPVISQPQSGIFGTYAIVKRPWIVQDELGDDVIAIRSDHEHRAHLRPPAGRRRLRQPLPARPGPTSPKPARDDLDEEVSL